MTKKKPNHIRKKLLVVDDDPPMRTMLCEILEMANYEVITVENGMVALEILQQQSIDLVITDVMMPQMSGIELTQKIRERYGAERPVILTSGSMIEAARFLENRYTRLIEKPYSINDLYKLINDLFLNHSNPTKVAVA